MVRFLALLFLAFLTTSAAAADFGFATVHSPSPFTTYDPGSTVTYAISVSITATAPEQLVVFTMPLPAGARFAGNRTGTVFTCGENGGTVTCLAPMSPSFSGPLFDVVAPAAGGRYVSHATLSSSSSSNTTTAATDITLNVYRPFVVTTTFDSGEGSLRQAILDGNTLCGAGSEPGCKISFELGAQTATIEPLTPLPDITACGLVIDGGAAPTASAPRRVALSGARVSGGDGLTIRTRCLNQRTGVTIQNLAIHSFPANGVLVGGNENGPFRPTTTQHTLIADFIGTDATGKAARPNGARGVAAYTNDSLSILSCNLSGNAHSGVFLWTLSEGTISGCRIDDNGASGVFTHADNVTIGSNEIARNHDMGIAIAPPTSNVYVPLDSIFRNGSSGIDHGLDGPSRRDNVQFPNAPVITSARYDGVANKTVITLHCELTPGEVAAFGPFLRVTVYANTTLDGWGHAEAERLIGVGETGSGGTVTVDVDGDLRGQFITANLNVFRFGDELRGETSELSDGVVVQ